MKKELLHKILEAGECTTWLHNEIVNRGYFGRKMEKIVEDFINIQMLLQASLRNFIKQEEKSPIKEGLMEKALQEWFDKMAKISKNKENFSLSKVASLNSQAYKKFAKKICALAYKPMEEIDLYQPIYY